MEDLMSNPTYSRIIAPIVYNRLMEQHRYIPEADRYIVSLVRALARRQSEPMRVLEIGCGPARLLRKFDKVRNINLVGLDHDQNFVTAGERIIEHQGGRATIICDDISTHRADKQYDIVVSQGMHHHIPKDDVPPYLENVRQFLAPGGRYIIGDEFLAPYSNAQDRQIVAILWYSHIIASALSKKQSLLATEETKTLLDDLAMGEDNPKSQEQIDAVLNAVGDIDRSATRGNVDRARQLAQRLLNVVNKLAPTSQNGDDRLDLSRGDFKVSGQVFRQEVATAKFRVIDTQWFGPTDVSGAMGVYVLHKEEG